jgi:dipeptidyl aminopeptidase/acylaminoacyl peptidase
LPATINDSKPMHQYNHQRIPALLLAGIAALAVAPLQAERRIEGTVLYDGVPAGDASLRAALLQYRVISESRLLGWLANGELLVATRLEEGEQLERLRAPGTLQAATSHAGATVLAATAQPFHSQLLAYLAEDAEHTGAALYVQDVAGGNERQLLSAGARPGAALFAHDGQRLAFTATLPGSASTSVYLAEVTSTAAPRLLLSGAGEDWQVLGWTRSDRAVLVRRTPPGADAELLLVDVDTGVARRVDVPATAGQAGAARRERAPSDWHITQAHLANDDRGVYFLSDRDADYLRLHYVDFYGGAPREFGAAVRRDIEQFDLSSDGRYLAYAWNDNGYSRVTLVDRPLNREVTVANLPVGVVHALRFANQGTRLAIDLAAGSAARDVYVYDLADATTTRWTRSALGLAGSGAAAGARALIAPQTLRFPTWDRPDGSPRLLSALVYKPTDGQSQAVLVMLPGRGRQARAQLDLFVQYLVTQLRIAVIAPDLRGASGHGRSFAALGRADERNGEALDLGALLAWIGAQPDLQRHPVVLMGNGDGGELALAALSLYGDRLRAAISVDGVAGVAQLTALRQPVLLLRGLEQPPLSAAAAEQLLWRLRSNAVESWFMAPRETLGNLAGADAQLAAQQTIVQFLLKVLADAAPPARTSAPPLSAPPSR